MVHTWVAVNLIECGKNIVIPMKFIYSMHRWLAYNRRINRNQVYLVFYSANYDQSPQFFLPKRSTFDETMDACYYAKLLKCFGKCSNFRFLDDFFF